MHTKFSMAKTSPVIDPGEGNDKNFKTFTHCVIRMTAELKVDFFFFIFFFAISFGAVKFLLGSNGFESWIRSHMP